MKRMSEVFELPVSGEEMQDHVAFRTFGDEDDAIAHAINHVDKLADALEESLAMLFMANNLHYGAGIDDPVIVRLRAVLDDYQGEL